VCTVRYCLPFGSSQETRVFSGEKKKKEILEAFTIPIDSGLAYQ
jgi:hypothetical protein